MFYVTVLKRKPSVGRKFGVLWGLSALGAQKLSGSSWSCFMLLWMPITISVPLSFQTGVHLMEHLRRT